MTREEAIQFLDNIKHAEAGRAIGKDGFYVELMGYHVEALNMAIKALEQEPCDDAVSRQYLLNLANKDGAYDYVSAKEIADAPSVNPHPCEDAISREAVEECKELMTDINGDTVYAVRMSDLRQLPSVTQKSGKWISTDFRKEEYVLVGKCSVCGQVRVFDEFCSHCGADMRGEE